jgi:CheY-like chemotaxis protein
MAGGTGDDAIASLTADPATRDLPAIVLTDLPQASVSQTCYCCQCRRDTPQTRKFKAVAVLAAATVFT